MTLPCLFLGSVLSLSCDSLLPPKETVEVVTLVGQFLLVSHLNRKDSLFKQSEESQGPSFAPTAQDLGSLGGSLGSSSPGGLPGEGGQQEGLERWIGRGGESGWEEGPWTAALGSGAIGSNPRHLLTPVGLSAGPSPSLDLSFPRL